MHASQCLHFSLASGCRKGNRACSCMQRLRSGVTWLGCAVKFCCADTPAMRCAVLCCAALCASAVCLCAWLGDTWWEVLPEPLRDVWRRKASNRRYVFTPAATDLQAPQPDGILAAFSLLSVTDQSCAAAFQQAEAAADAASQGYFEDMKRCCLALLLWWARWSLGEPIVVRDVKVSLSEGSACLKLQHWECWSATVPTTGTCGFTV